MCYTHFSMEFFFRKFICITSCMITYPSSYQIIFSVIGSLSLPSLFTFRRLLRLQPMQTQNYIVHLFTSFFSPRWKWTEHSLPLYRLIVIILDSSLVFVFLSIVPHLHQKVSKIFSFLPHAKICLWIRTNVSSDAWMAGYGFMCVVVFQNRK